MLRDERGKGYGRAVMQALENLARGRGMPGITLAAQLHAIGFYERLGARPNSEWTVYRLTGEALTSLGRE